VALPLLSLPLCAQSQTPIGELFVSDPGAPTLVQTAGTGMNVLPGSELSAGIAPATLKLLRGGQVRICPRSSLSVNSGGEGLMLGMSTGAIEINYRLDQPVADFLVTPDFNIRLAGPATYHFAVGVNGKGDTCFKSLTGNTSRTIFTELLGEGIYEVAANEAAVFPGGKLGGRTALTEECGCPQAPPALRAAAPVKQSGNDSPAHVPAVNSDVTAPLPTDRPGQTHVEVDAPFVFSARAAGARPNTVARVQFSSLPNVFFLQDEAEPVVLPERLAEKPPEAPAKAEKQEPAPGPVPVPKKEKEKKGFMDRIKGFFGSIFHR
jgi:hypothetical protein